MTNHDRSDFDPVDHLGALEPHTVAATATSPRRIAALAAVGAAAVVAGVVLALAISFGPRDGVAAPSASTAASIEPSESPGASASSTPAAASPSPSTDVAPPTVVGPIIRWEQVASFGSEGYAEEVRDMAFAAGRFIAIGYREPDTARGHVGPPLDQPRIWTSSNGAEWKEVALGPGFEHAHFTSIVALPDGTAAIYGTLESSDGMTVPFGPAAWNSADGLTWTRMEVVQPSPDPIPRVADGPEAFITVRWLDSARSEIWRSTDGRTWTAVHQIDAGEGYLSVSGWEAGPEGFVVVGYRGPAGGGVDGARPFTLASSDGVTWFEAAPGATPVDLPAVVVPLRGDWVASAESISDVSDASVDIWYSANGLDWTRRGTLAVTVPEHDYEPKSAGTIGRLVSTGDRVIASGSVIVCCHGPWWAAGVFGSSDGMSWEPLDFPDGTVVSAAAEHEGTVVLGGFAHARPEDEFKTTAVFWIGLQE